MQCAQLQRLEALGIDLLAVGEELTREAWNSSPRRLTICWRPSSAAGAPAQR
jgi:hypothetical protein